jgi:predicted outer membrane protein
MFAGSVAAQQTQGTTREQSSQIRQDGAASSQAGQSDRSSVQQTEQSTLQGRGGAERSQRYTANFRGESAAAGGANKQVEQFVAGCLLAKNQAEIKLSKLAEQQSQNPQVKELAQMMIRDHQQLVDKLQQHVGTQTGAARAGGTAESTRLSAQSRDTADRSATTGETDPLSDRSEAGTPDATTRGIGTETTTGRSLAGTPGGESANAGIQQLTQIEKQIVDRQTEAARQELEQKEGAEFDKCFVGMVIGAHVNQNAALEVLGQQNLGQVSQLAQEAQPKVQQHLDHAKQLMKQLEGQTASTGNRAARETSERQR